MPLYFSGQILQQIPAMPKQKRLSILYTHIKSCSKHAKGKIDG
jgi:hypothetical protein